VAALAGGDIAVRHPQVANVARLAADKFDKK
jgi:hypothetical protein